MPRTTSRAARGGRPARPALPDPARAAIGCGLALAAIAAAIRAWWERLRRAPAETGETRRLGLRGTCSRAGSCAIFARVTTGGPPVMPGAARPPPLPVVLVHGLVVSSRMVEPLAGALGRHGLRVLAPDLPGFGESAKPPRPLGPPALADALALWLWARGIPRAMFLGTSFGCQVLVELALRHPRLVDRLVLQGPGPEPAARSLPRALWRQAVNAWREPRRIGRISRIDYAKAGIGRASATIRMALGHRVEDRLPLVRAPTLVVRGGRDVICPQPWAEHVARLLPRGRLAVVEGGAHVLSYGAPEALAAAVLPFLRETATADAEVERSR